MPIKRNRAGQEVFSAIFSACTLKLFSGSTLIFLLPMVLALACSEGKDDRDKKFQNGPVVGSSRLGISSQRWQYLRDQMDEQEQINLQQESQLRDLLEKELKIKRQAMAARKKGLHKQPHLARRLEQIMANTFRQEFVSRCQLSIREAPRIQKDLGEKDIVLKNFWQIAIPEDAIKVDLPVLERELTRLSQKSKSCRIDLGGQASLFYFRLLPQEQTGKTTGLQKDSDSRSGDLQPFQFKAVKKSGKILLRCLQSFSTSRVPAVGQQSVLAARRRFCLEKMEKELEKQYPLQVKGEQLRSLPKSNNAGKGK